MPQNEICGTTSFKFGLNAALVREVGAKNWSMRIHAFYAMVVGLVEKKSSSSNA